MKSSQTKKDKHFICVNCKRKVSITAPGTKNRNHCPFCLCSLHVDIIIGDRRSSCKGIMFAEAKMYKPDGEEVLVHKCSACGEIRKNRVAGDDDYEAVEKLPTIDYF